MIKRVMAAAIIAALGAGSAQAITAGVTEGKRDLVGGTVAVSTVDATPNDPGFGLGTLSGVFGIYGRIVSSEDVFEFDFATDNGFSIVFDLDGYTTTNTKNDQVGAIANASDVDEQSGLMGVFGGNNNNFSGLNPGKVVEFTLTNWADPGSAQTVSFTADQNALTSPGALFTVMAGGNYSLRVNGSIDDPDGNEKLSAFYDLNINVVPVPFGAVLLATAIAGLGVRSRLRRG